MKLKKHNYIFLLLTILWMLVIFTFSAKPADESTKQSNYIGMIIGSVIISDFNELPKDQQQLFADSIDFYVRKAAHATEYMVLSILCYGLLLGIVRNNLLCISAWLMSVIYSCTDEFHQLFVPGRAGRFFDIGVDAIGALVGVIIVALFMSIIVKYKEK